MLENQPKEIDCIKEDTALLKSDVEVLKQRSSESSASRADTPPSRKKLPTELSVSSRYCTGCPEQTWITLYHVHELYFLLQVAVKQLQEKSTPEKQFKGSEG